MTLHYLVRFLSCIYLHAHLHLCFRSCYTASMGDILTFLCTNTLSSDVFYSNIFYLCSSFEQGNALIFYL
jgi:hypothetical protein